MRDSLRFSGLNDFGKDFIKKKYKATKMYASLVLHEGNLMIIEFRKIRINTKGIPLKNQLIKTENQLIKCEMRIIATSISSNLETYLRTAIKKRNVGNILDFTRVPWNPKIRPDNITVKSFMEFTYCYITGCMAIVNEPKGVSGNLPELEKLTVETPRLFFDLCNRISAIGDIATKDIYLTELGNKTLEAFREYSVQQELPLILQKIGKCFISIDR